SNLSGNWNWNWKEARARSRRGGNEAAERHSMHNGARGELPGGATAHVAPRRWWRAARRQ
ncbi:MAG: hypothetical protein ACPIOQ_34285, partial [Promethearchaeia archaeon]